MVDAAGVTFDLWETLLIDELEKDLARREMRCEGLRQVLSRHGKEVSIQGLFRGYDESTGWLQNIWNHNRDVSTAEQLHYITKVASKGTIELQDLGEIEELKEAYLAPILTIPPILNDHTTSTLRSIHRRGYKIGLICNTGRSPGVTLRQLLDRFGVLSYFDATIFSDEVGWRKPDRRIFAAAAEKLRMDISNIVHIGDDPERDVWGAKQAGMRAILLEYEVPEEFEREPRSLFALSRSTRFVKDSEIRPDAQISTLKEVPEVIDHL